LSATKRLPGVDGLRALAAMWVVLFHMSAFSGEFFHGIPGLDVFLRSGSTGVSLFLVLSGFCLFLPFAGGRLDRFKAGEFFRRRCKRLMPAYYVALVLALALAVVTAGKWGLPSLSLGDTIFQLVTHIALVHTLFPTTFYSLNGAFWSLGLEWQLYLALPLLILLTRRFGLAQAVALAVAVNVIYRLAVGLVIDAGLVDSNELVAISVLPNQLPGRWAEFAFGMVAADLYASGRLERWSRFLPGMLIAIVVLIPTSLVASQFQLGHIVYGSLFFTLLCVVLASNNPVARILGWRPLVALGTMSYSLYLVHQPAIQLVATWLQLNRPDLSPSMVFYALLATFPLVLLVAWLLFITVERRTMGPNAADALLPPRFRVAWFASSRAPQPAGEQA
jgi:peptidoglycan/LPS O-acetylase OafA/YrhL